MLRTGGDPDANASTIPLEQKYDAYAQTGHREASAQVPCSPIPLEDIPRSVPAIIDVDIHRAGKAQTKRDTVIDNRGDQTRSNALMLLLHRVRENDRRGGERHVHAPWYDYEGNEGLSPVCLMDGRGGSEDEPDGEEAHCKNHDHGRPELREGDSCCHGGEEATHGDGGHVCYG